MAISIVQTKTARDTSGSFSVTFDSTTTSGNLIVVSFPFRVILDTGESDISVTDNKSNTFTKAFWKENVSENINHAACWYVQNATGGSSHSITITITERSGEDTAKVNAVIYEVSGVKTSGALDATNTGDGTGTAATSGNVTPAANGTLLIANCKAQTETTTLTDEGGWTARYNANGSSTVDKIQATAAAEDADFTLSSSEAWAAGIAAFAPTVTATRRIFIT